MVRMASTWQGIPYTWTPRIAVVGAVMRGSIFAGSIVIDTGSMSAKTGVMLFHESTWGVAGKVMGVVITSPANRKARQTTMIAHVQLLNRERSAPFRRL